MCGEALGPTPSWGAWARRVRMALGAAPRVLVANVMARAALMVVPGLLTGLACARAASRLLERFLHDAQQATPSP